MATQKNNVKAGYKYATLEEAREANRQKARARYQENKEKINNQQRERTRQRREISDLIMKDPEIYQDFLNYREVINNPQMYQYFTSYLQILNDPQLYQNFIDWMSKID